jgi:hypothetical protein
MAPGIELIYCANGNRRFAEIAIGHGFLYGAQMPGTVYFPPVFCDQDWKRPNRQIYMAKLAEHRPYIASVLDLERPAQLAEVLGWAEDAAQWVEVIMIIPKFFGAIDLLPRVVAGKTVRLGYSVPTKFGGTEVPVWEFAGWPVHLLGGSPQRQMGMCSYLNVVSADGNYAQKMAIQYGQFWTPGDARYAANRYWPKLSEAGNLVNDDMPYVAFERSCKNIMTAWASLASAQ